MNTETGYVKIMEKVKIKKACHRQALIHTVEV